MNILQTGRIIDALPITRRLVTFRHRQVGWWYVLGMPLAKEVVEVVIIGM